MKCRKMVRFRYGAHIADGDYREAERLICAGRRPRPRWSGILEDDLLETWQKLRQTALEMGPQRVYASAKAVMFARSVYYCFVKTRKKSLEL